MVVPQIELDGRLGQDIDFDNSRPAHGATFDVTATARPTNHIELAAVWNDQSLDVDAAGARQRLFTARVGWVGYGDDRSLTRGPGEPGAPPPADRLRPVDRQVFIKLSYAIQR